MKKILVITIDITVASADATSLYEAIKAYGGWWHYLKSTWLLHTDKTPEQIVSELSPHIKGKGRMLVLELHRPYQGMLPKEAWEWINGRVN